MTWVIAVLLLLVLGGGGAMTTYLILNEPGGENLSQAHGIGQTETTPEEPDTPPVEEANNVTQAPANSENDKQQQNDVKPAKPQQPGTSPNVNNNPQSPNLKPKKQPKTKVNEVQPNPPPKKKTPPQQPNNNPPPTQPVGTQKKSVTKKSTGDYRTALTAENQKKVNDAVDRGVKWLLTQQKADGGWGHPTYKVGYTALPALTLLECGIAADDPAIQKAADFVREHSHNLNRTYELSLAILFLDKFGEKKDHNLIRKLGLRLIAGQTANGGWSYRCPLLTNREAYELLTVLHETRPERLEIPIANENPDLPIPIGKKEDPAFPDTLPGENDGKAPISGEGGKRSQGPIPANRNGDEQTERDKKKPADEGLALPFPSGSNKKNKDSQNTKNNGPQNSNQKPASWFKPIPINQLSKSVRKLAVVKLAPLPKINGLRRQPFLSKVRSDNSNSQFAIMALWAARRYNIPVERTMALVDQRYLSSQLPDGSWGYRYMTKKSRHTMTCVGLIGLAVGHGSYKELFGNAWKNTNLKQAKQDPSIQFGLKALGRHVGESPEDWTKPVRMANLYFIWSLERVAMLYSLKTIGGKDWYNWAAHMLVMHQRLDGEWHASNYHGSNPIIDTSLALLVLRRANLVEDLTQSLRLYIPIEDPDARR